jgi:hypothetical protein
LAEFSIIQLQKESVYAKDYVANSVIDLKFHALEMYYEPRFLSMVIQLVGNMTDVLEDLSYRTKYFEHTITLKKTKRKNLQVCTRLKQLNFYLIDYGSTFAQLSMCGTEV